jgi:hypothetical protein
MKPSKAKPMTDREALLLREQRVIELENQLIYARGRVKVLEKDLKVSTIDAEALREEIKSLEAKAALASVRIIPPPAEPVEVRGLVKGMRVTIEKME